MASVDFLHIKPEPVTLHSGGLSQFIIDADGLFADERMRDAIISYWKRYLDRVQRNNRLHIIGIERGGTPWAVELYKAMEKDAPGEHTFNKSTDEIAPAEGPSQIVVVDDVLTTGGSINELANSLSPFPTVALIVIDRRWNREGSGGNEIWLPDAQHYISICPWTRMPLPMEVA